MVTEPFTYRAVHISRSASAAQSGAAMHQSDISRYKQQANTAPRATPRQTSGLGFPTRLHPERDDAVRMYSGESQPGLRSSWFYSVL
jgi:hypothetical protein